APGRPRGTRDLRRHQPRPFPRAAGPGPRGRAPLRPVPRGRAVAPVSERAGLVAVLLLAAAVRLPFFVQALHTPVDGDTAIVGLMARHLRSTGTTLWGQPYGSPLDAWVAAPFVASLGPTRAAVRTPYLLLGLALVPLAFALARQVHPRAGLPAAFLLACPPAYLLLFSALPP